MVNVALVFLALFAVIVFERSFAMGVALAGLIWVAWKLNSRLAEVSQKLKRVEDELEAGMSERALQHMLQADSQQTDKSEADTNEQPEQSITETSDSTDSNEEALQDLQEVAEDQDSKPASHYRYHPLNRQSDTVTTSTSAESEDLQEELSQPNTAQEPYALNQASEPAEPAQPAEPRGPNLIEKVVAYAWSWVTDGNVFVRVGIIVLFMGMTFLTRYAIGQNLIPIEVRLAAISAIAIALLFWGWRQRETRQGFSLVVQGGGVGLLYLTIFAGFSLYSVIPSTIAFVLLALVVVLAAVLAIMQDAKPLALFATIGGFLAPILTSSGNNNYVGLFSYYSILNIGIFAIAWFKSWRILNFVGFVFTFLVSTVWGVLSYEKEFFASTEPFLILFFLLYVGIGILFAHKRTPIYKDYVDSSLIFGTPIFAFGLQCAMVKDYEYGVAISAAVLGIFYLVLTAVLWKKYGARLRLLSETFLSIGVIFTTLAIPFAIDGHLSGAAWAIEGAGILWVSIKQQQTYRRFFGIALIFAAGAMLLYGLQTVAVTSSFINSFFIGCVIVTIAATIASWLLSQNFESKTSIESFIANAVLVYAVVVLLGGFEIQINHFQLFAVHGSLLAVLSALVIGIYTTLANKLAWPKGHWVSVSFVLPLSMAAALCFDNQVRPSDFYGYLIWPLALTVCFYGLKQAVGTVHQRLVLIAHILAALTIACLLLWAGIWQLMLGYSLFAIVFNHLSNRFNWPQLKLLALGFFPVLVVCSLLAISVDGNLVTLSNFAGSLRPPFPPGFLLWPFGFVVYFYLVHQNKHIGGANNKYLHYAGGVLVGGLLSWLGLGPLMLGASLLAVLFCILSQKYEWPEMRVLSLALLPIMLLTVIIKFLDGSFHLTSLAGLGGLNFASQFEIGFVLWPLSFLAVFWTFWQFDKRKQSAPALFHSASLVMLSGLLTWEVSWHLLDYLDFLNAWHMAWLPISFMLVIALVLRAKVWPFSEHQHDYQQLALPLLASAPIAWSFAQLISSANSSPLPWLPLLNPIGVVQIIILMGAFFWGAKLLPKLLNRLSDRYVVYGVAAYGFLWANVELLRGVHHWVGIPWQLPAILSADVSQTLMALFWALSGLFVTTFASKKMDRTLWYFGGALLVAVVLKLFLVDLSAQDTVERIVSFTGVGLLLVAVGYFSPLPPKEGADKTQGDQSENKGEGVKSNA